MSITLPRWLTIDSTKFRTGNGLSPVYNPATNSFDAAPSTADGSGLLVLDGSAGTDITLTAAQSQNGNIVVNGATAAINVIVYGTSQRSWRVYNNNGGSYAVTFKTSAGTGVAVAANGKASVECDGTNIVSIAGGGGVWGAITGTLSDQTDLGTALDAKAAGAASSTDNAIARFDSTTGKIIQNSSATIDDSGNIAATNLSGNNTGDQDLSGYAPLSSPALTGVPTAPTATLGTNTTQIATTAFVLANATGGGSGSGADDDSAYELLANKDTDGTMSANSDTKYPSQKAVVTYVAANAGSGVFSAIASQAEAEAGTDNTKGMTPLRTAEAIAALATGGGGSVDDATIRFDIYRYRF